MSVIETTAVVSASALLTWSMVAGVFYRYWPLSPRRRELIERSTVHHYIPSEFVEVDGGNVAVRARAARHATMNFIRGPAAFYYVGRNGRGGWMNHPRAVSRAYSRIDIPGTEFSAWLADNPAWYRRWDGALFVQRDYVGVGRVISGVEPRRDRQSSA